MTWRSPSAMRTMSRTRDLPLDVTPDEGSLESSPQAQRCRSTRLLELSQTRLVFSLVRWAAQTPAELNRRPTRRLAAAPKADVQEPQGDRAQALGTLFVRHTDQESPGACDRPDEAADRLEPDPVEAPALATAGDD